jgi:hypothetical protein
MHPAQLWVIKKAARRGILSQAAWITEAVLPDRGLAQIYGLQVFS